MVQLAKGAHNTSSKITHTLFGTISSVQKCVNYFKGLWTHHWSEIKCEYWSKQFMYVSVYVSLKWVTLIMNSELVINLNRQIGIRAVNLTLTIPADSRSNFSVWVCVFIGSRKPWIKQLWSATHKVRRPSYYETGSKRGEKIYMYIFINTTAVSPVECNCHV